MTKHNLFVVFYPIFKGLGPNMAEFNKKKAVNEKQCMNYMETVSK